MSILIVQLRVHRLQAWFARPFSAGHRMVRRTPRPPRVPSLLTLPPHMRRDLGLPPQTPCRPAPQAPPPFDPFRFF
jgi:hypothetical protein